MTLVDQRVALEAVARFQEAFGRQDPDGVLTSMAAVPVFESTAPPDGQRYEGREEVREAFADFFRSSAGATFDTEEQFICGDIVVVLWRYTWGNGTAEKPGHVRGVDLFRVQEGLVAEKRSYVKG